MNFKEIKAELELLRKKDNLNLDPKTEADNSGSKSENPFGLDLELLGGSRPRHSIM